MKKTHNIKLLEEFDQTNDALHSIASELAGRMHCDMFGSCIHFAEEFVDAVAKTNSNLLADFFVVEGYVDTTIGDGIPQQHTWIELGGGDKIDPTFEQFSKFDSNAVYVRKIKHRYTGLQYYEAGKHGTWFSERRKNNPEWFFKR